MESFRDTGQTGPLKPNLETCGGIILLGPLHTIDLENPPRESRAFETQTGLLYYPTFSFIKVAKSKERQQLMMNLLVFRKDKDKFVARGAFEVRTDIDSSNWYYGEQCFSDKTLGRQNVSLPTTTKSIQFRFGIAESVLKESPWPEVLPDSLHHPQSSKVTAPILISDPVKQIKRVGIHLETGSCYSLYHAIIQLLCSIPAFVDAIRWYEYKSELSFVAGISQDILMIWWKQMIPDTSSIVKLRYEKIEHYDDVYLFLRKVALNITSEVANYKLTNPFAVFLHDLPKKSSFDDKLAIQVQSTKSSNTLSQFILEKAKDSPYKTIKDTILVNIKQGKEHIAFEFSQDFGPLFKGDGKETTAKREVLYGLEGLIAKVDDKVYCYYSLISERWYKIQDDKIWLVGHKEVLTSDACILLYTRRSAPKKVPETTSTKTISSKQTEFTPSKYKIKVDLGSGLETILDVSLEMTVDKLLELLKTKTGKRRALALKNKKTLSIDLVIVSNSTEAKTTKVLELVCDGTYSLYSPLYDEENPYNAIVTLKGLYEEATLVPATVDKPFFTSARLSAKNCFFNFLNGNVVEVKNGELTVSSGLALYYIPEDMVPAQGTEFQTHIKSIIAEIELMNSKRCNTGCILSGDIQLIKKSPLNSSLFKNSIREAVYKTAELFYEKPAVGSITRNVEKPQTEDHASDSEEWGSDDEHVTKTSLPSKTSNQPTKVKDDEKKMSKNIGCTSSAVNDWEGIAATDNSGILFSEYDKMSDLIKQYLNRVSKRQVQKDGIDSMASQML